MEGSDGNALQGTFRLCRSEFFRDRVPKPDGTHGTQGSSTVEVHPCLKVATCYRDF